MLKQNIFTLIKKSVQLRVESVKNYVYELREMFQPIPISKLLKDTVTAERFSTRSSSLFSI